MKSLRLSLLALLFVSLQSLSAAPTITATQDDAVPAATRKLVGDTVTYTTTISNTAPVIVGSTANDATAVVLTNPTPANTTDSGSVTISPVAFDDVYPQIIFPNIGINSGNIPYSAFSNDFLGTPAVTTIASFTQPAHGAVSMVTSGANTGQFTYEPAAGYSGADSFTYTLTNSVGSSVGTVNLTVLASPTIWFVNPAVGVTGTGTLSSPFKTVAEAVTAIGANTSHRIFLYSGAQTTGITLKANGWLVGQAATGTNFDTVMGIAPPSGFIARPTLNSTKPAFSNASGSVVTLADNNTILGVAITGGATGAAVVSSGTVNTGAIGNATTSDVTISGAGGGAFSLGAGNGAFNVNAPITSVTGRSVAVTSRTGGTVAFTGAISDTGTGISLTTNTGATINFSGGLSLSTGVNAAFTATGGGTVNATQNNTTILNTLATTTGTALTVANTTIGASNLTFRSITAGTGAGSAGNGITLDTTGSSGGLRVVGNGTNIGATGGGVIQHKTGADASTTAGNGIYLNSTFQVSLNGMQLNDFDNHGIFGLSVNGFKMTNSTVGGTIGTTSGSNDLTLEAPIQFGKTSPSLASGLAGSSLIDNVNISGGIQHNVEIYQDSGTFNLTISNSNIHNNGTALGSDGVNIETTNTATGFIKVNNTTFDNNKSQALQASTLVTSTLHLTLDTNTIKNTTQGNEGFVIQNAASSHLFVAITNNTFGTGSGTTPSSGIVGTNILVGNVALNATSASTLDATVTGNTMWRPFVASGGGNRTLIAFFSAGVNGVASADVSTSKVLIDNNTINTVSDPAQGLAEPLFVSTPDGSSKPLFYATVSNNKVNITDTGGTALRGIAVQSTQTTSTGHVDVRGNDVTYVSEPGGAQSPPGINGIRLRQVTPATLDLEPGVGGATAAAALAANNPAPHTSGTEVSGTVTLSANNNTALLPTTPTAPSLPGFLIYAKAIADLAPDSSSLLTAMDSSMSQAPRETARVANARPVTEVHFLTQAELDSLVATARERWEATGLKPEQLAVLSALKFEAAELSGLHLGEANGNQIRVDTDAGGNGWFVGSDDDAAFIGDSTRRHTTPSNAPAGRIDLLTTIMHEMGHALGLNDSYLEQDRDSLMYGFLTKGERRLPAKNQALGAVPNEKSGAHFLAAPVNLNTLPPGKTVKVVYSVTVGPITGNPQSVSSQAVISGSNFGSVNAVDAVAGSGPTITLLGIAPAFTSANATTFTVGTAGNFNVAANGAPPPTFSFTGSLPSGVTLTSAGVLSGTPAANTGGTYPITITASNGIGIAAMQSFVLTVNQAPAITSATAATFVVGTNGSFSVTKTGFPAPTLSQTGTLPSGVTFTPATGVLSGTPDPGTGGVYPITFTAANGVGSNAVQNFTLTVNQAPALTSANTTTLTVGTSGMFTVTASGFPSPTLALTSGTLPSGVTFNPVSGILSGTPGNNTYGTYALVFTASNGVGSNATQNFSLIVNPSASDVKSKGAITAEPGGGFRVTFVGNPGVQYTVQFAPTLPALPTLPNWQFLGLQVAGANGSFFIIDNPPVGTTTRVYRAIIP